eukprot:TRINITY_DN6852_c0_g1_i1.p3 TRINITY_DN6852_c0_g1~~TRINITY_DN6852_c0_g1_i1.p3  ORF type:complete len:125 (-),score=7.98 TRINITY_DN6852_c0_g1_i1:190-564(-)
MLVIVSHVSLTLVDGTVSGQRLESHRIRISLILARIRAYVAVRVCTFLYDVIQQQYKMDGQNYVVLKTMMCCFVGVFLFVVGYELNWACEVAICKVCCIVLGLDNYGSLRQVGYVVLCFCNNID